MGLWKRRVRLVGLLLVVAAVAGWVSVESVGMVVTMETDGYVSPHLFRIRVGKVSSLFLDEPIKVPGGGVVVTGRRPVPLPGKMVSDRAVPSSIESGFNDERVVGAIGTAREVASRYLGYELSHLRVRTPWFGYGSSAGLVTALLFIEHERGPFVPEGVRVAATGTLYPSGFVGAVGSAGWKAEAAAAAGMDVLLVPVANVEEAREAVAGSTMQVVGVRTVVQAVSVLCRLDESLPACVRHRETFEAPPSLPDAAGSEGRRRFVPDDRDDPRSTAATGVSGEVVAGASMRDCLTDLEVHVYGSSCQKNLLSVSQPSRWYEMRLLMEIVSSLEFSESMSSRFDVPASTTSWSSRRGLRLV